MHVWHMRGVHEADNGIVHVCRERALDDELWLDEFVQAELWRWRRIAGEARIA